MKVPSVGGPKVESGYSERFVVERVEDSGTPEAFEGKRVHQFRAHIPVAVPQRFRGSTRRFFFLR